MLCQQAAHAQNIACINYINLNTDLLHVNINDDTLNFFPSGMEYLFNLKDDFATCIDDNYM